jgi:hypothetical protein
MRLDFYALLLPSHIRSPKAVCDLLRSEKGLAGIGVHVL